MAQSDTTIWLIIIILGICTYLNRLSFIGLIGDKKMPDFVLSLLRYTPVAVLPGLVAPLTLWPEATGGEMDPARLCAAFATLIAGMLTKNVLIAIVSGFCALYLVPMLF